MKIATQALVSLMIITMLTLSSVSGVGAVVQEDNNDREDRKMQRLHYHDRNYELRASLLNMQPEELKTELQDKSFDQVIKKRGGFTDRQAFYTAFVGKVKDELKKHGMSEQRIGSIIQKRLSRLG